MNGVPLLQQSCNQLLYIAYMLLLIKLNLRVRYLPPTKEEVHVFARVCLSACLSVCQLARLLKNACIDLDEMLCVDR